MGMGGRLVDLMDQQEQNEHKSILDQGQENEHINGSTRRKRIGQDRKPSQFQPGENAVNSSGEKAASIPR